MLNDYSTNIGLCHYGDVILYGDKGNVYCEPDVKNSDRTKYCSYKLILDKLQETLPMASKV